VDDALSRWLCLREPADVAARSMSLTHAVAERLSSHSSVRVLDLGTGTGSNIRYLAERLPPRQSWLVLDRNAALLAELPRRMAQWGAARGREVHTREARCVIRSTDFDCDIETRQTDLGTLTDHRVFAGRHLVTASALLDLVSESWLRALAAHCRMEGALALFTITYNGSFVCTPAEDEDNMVRDLMNRHQKTDKGLGGRAAGPDAGVCAERCFMEAGYSVRRESSDWTLDARADEVQKFLIDGWAEAANEMAPERAPTIDSWRARRLAHVVSGRSRILVGHDDLAAWPQEQAIR
jgi:hypothetical protein